MDESYTLHVTLVTEGTLFRSVIEVNYLTMDGTWRTVSKNLGTVDISGNSGCSFSLENYKPGEDIDFQYFGPTSQVFYFNETTKLETIKINAYGYRNP
ncbi:MAG: hypothetical protein ACPLKQ_07735 [Candidatus Bathyarchaeales archaeon]